MILKFILLSERITQNVVIQIITRTFHYNDNLYFKINFSQFLYTVYSLTPVSYLLVKIIETFLSPLLFFLSSTSSYTPSHKTKTPTKNNNKSIYTHTKKNNNLYCISRRTSIRQLLLYYLSLLTIISPFLLIEILVSGTHLLIVVSHVHYIVNVNLRTY